MTSMAVTQGTWIAVRTWWLRGTRLSLRSMRGLPRATAAAAPSGVACRLQHNFTAGPMMLSRRTYLDSVDRTMTVKSMSDPLEVLHFMAEHADSDTRTHEAALRTLGNLSKTVKRDTYQKIMADGRFHALLSALAGRLDDCDARTLSMVADASSRFRISSPELTELAQRLAEVVIRREDAFSPRNLSSVAIALAVRGIRDVATVEFVRTEVLKLVDELEPSHCVMILEAFRRWGVFDRQLVDLVVERMLDEVDRFAGKDVVDAFAVASRIGLARGFLLRRLCTLAFENLRQFQPRELAKVAHSLARLRFLSESSLDDLIDTLRPDLPRLAGAQVSDLLFAVAMVDARHQLDLARGLIAQYADGGSLESRTLVSLVDVAWSICALELVDEFEKEFKAIAEEIFGRQPIQNRMPLTKLFDVICCLELEHQGRGVTVPPAWRAACDDADRFEMDKLESSRLHNEIVMRFDHLRGMAAGTRWQLRMLRNQQCGPYRVDMLDEDTKIALDVEIVSWPTARHLKHRLLKGLGFLPLRLDYWEWRRARTEEDQNTFLEREVCAVMEGTPLSMGSSAN